MICVVVFQVAVGIRLRPIICPGESTADWSPFLAPCLVSTAHPATATWNPQRYLTWAPLELTAAAVHPYLTRVVRTLSSPGIYR